MGPFHRMSSTRTLPSSTSTHTPDTPRTPVTMCTAPPSYADSAHINASPFCSIEAEDVLRISPSRAASWMTLPDMVVVNPEQERQLSSYYSSSPRNGADEFSITDAYMDSRSASPTSLERDPTPMPITSSELPMRPPPVVAFHRPFSPPSVYPITQSHIARTLNTSQGPMNGISVTVHTQSSRESL
ncbi:hypothetical protein FB446DRAFT_157128 [Lentinula raphanica]|nr:hypothetical protein FB446DRAFT_157128 [Lentinula raphanica]